MFFKMQNMLVGERLRIFRVKNTFFQNQELSFLYQIWLVFDQKHFDFSWVRNGISAGHSEPWLPSGYTKSGFMQWKKSVFFSKFEKTENCFVILVAGVSWVIVTAGVNRKGGKKLNNIIWPLALTSIKKSIKNRDSCGNFTTLITWDRTFL